MGQSNWAWGCALLLALTVVGHVVAEEADRDPFAQEPGASPSNATPEKKPAASSYSPGEAEQRIESVLDQPLREPLDFIEQPLRDVVDILEETYDIPIQFDTAALDAVAASPDVEVSVQINNVTLRSALDLMLNNAGAEELTYIIDNEVLLITTQEEAETRLEVIVYRVDDLVSLDASRTELDRLIDIVVASVGQESWKNSGTGEGEINSFAPAMLVVSQTHHVHEQLERLLDSVRRTKAAIETDNAAEREAASHRPVTRAIRVRDAANAKPEDRNILQQALIQSVDWQVAGEDVAEDDVFLHVMSDRVLVRHVPAVIRQVELAIREISPSSPPTDNRGGGGMEGGGAGMEGRGGGGRGGF